MSHAAALALIQEGKRFLVSCHRRPDGDALGSALGLVAVLRAAGKEAVLYHPEPLPRSLRFLPGTDRIVSELSDGDRFDATFVTDTAAGTLLPQPFPDRSVGGTLVVLDHHAAHDDFGDVVVRETGATSTGVLIVRLMRDLGLDAIPQDAVTPLYASMVADTGGFRYPGTDARTLRLAADLLEAGADPWEVAYNLFEGWPAEKAELLRAMLGTLRRSHGDQLALMRVSQAMLVEAGADDEMVEGLVNYGRRIDGVEVAALVWELAPVEGEVRTKVSLRSRGRVDVSRIAVELGGGGHANAAAAEIAVDPDEAEIRVLEIAGRVLREAGLPEET